VHAGMVFLHLDADFWGAMALPQKSVKATAWTRFGCVDFATRQTAPEGVERMDGKTRHTFG